MPDPDHPLPASPETADSDSPAASTPMPVPAAEPAPGPERRVSRDPLHGVTLEQVLRHLIDVHGWDYLADRVPVRCFMFDPTLSSSLKFLRKTPWARKKVEDLYRFQVTC